MTNKKKTIQQLSGYFIRIYKKITVTFYLTSFKRITECWASYV